MRSIEIEVRTGDGRGLWDLTPACARFAAEARRDCRRGSTACFRSSCPTRPRASSSWSSGQGSDEDLVAALDRLLPREERLYRHRHGSPGHGADHVLPLFVSPSLTVPVLGGRLALGTWQSIALLDPNADNDRRRVRLSFLASG